MTLLVDGLLFIRITRLVFTINNEMGLANFSFIVNHMMTKDPVVFISIDSVIINLKAI